MHKIIMLGDSNVGKSSLLYRFTDRMFYHNSRKTDGIDFKIKVLKVDGNIIKLQLWKARGQESYKCISNSYLRNAHGCIAVYDITNR